MVLIVGRADDVAIGIDDIRPVTIRGRKCQEQNAIPAYEASLSHTAIDCLKTGNLGIWESGKSSFASIQMSCQRLSRPLAVNNKTKQDQAKQSKTKQHQRILHWSITHHHRVASNHAFSPVTASQLPGRRAHNTVRSWMMLSHSRLLISRGSWDCTDLTLCCSK